MGAEEKVGKGCGASTGAHLRALCVLKNHQCTVFRNRRGAPFSASLRLRERFCGLPAKPRSWGFQKGRGARTGAGWRGWRNHACTFQFPSGLKRRCGFSVFGQASLLAEHLSLRVSGSYRDLGGLGKFYGWRPVKQKSRYALAFEGKPAAMCLFQKN